MDIFAAQNRKTLYGILILSGIVLLLGGMLLGFCLAPGREKTAPETQQAQTALSSPLPSATPNETPGPALPVSEIGAPSILPTTEVVWEAVFSSCGHTYKQQTAPDVTGYTQTALRERFADVEVRAFSAERVLLAQPYTGYCPAHLLVTLREDKPVILQTDPQTFAVSVLIELNWDITELSPTALAELEKGIPFSDLGQIDQFIEGLES